MSQLDPRVEVIRKQYDLSKDDFWKLPQGRDVWLVKHAALEVVAAKAGITFDMPEILEAKSAEGVAAICVRGFYGDRAIWSIGEASPKNCKNAYPWAIAEKRAVDRVILKLIGLHGLVYSEEEIDDSRPGAEAPTKRQVGISPQTGMATAHALKKDTGPDNWNAFQSELLECETVPMLTKLALSWSSIAERDLWPVHWRNLAKEEINKRRELVLNGVVDDDVFPGDRPSNGKHISTIQAG